MLRAAGIVGIAGLTACLSTPDAVPLDGAAIDGASLDAALICEDGDGDHWPAGQGGACETAEHLDCNDEDAAEHPGAYESANPVGDVDCDGTAWDGTGRMTEVVSAEAGGSLTVTIGALQLVIDDEQGHSIADLRVTPTDNLLYTGPMQERLIAMEAWQSFFSWEDAGAEDIRAIEVDARPVLRFQVDWNDGTDLEGLTTWTMHAGGRLYRRDVAQLHQAPSQNNVTSYVALDDSAVTHIDFENGTAEPIVFAEGTFEIRANTPGSRWLCAYHATGDYEIGFLAQPTTSEAIDGSRITWSQTSPDPSGTTAQAALQYDWTGAAPPAIGDYTGSFQIVAGPNPGSPCTTVSAADAAWRNAPSLLLTGGTAGTAPGGEDADGDGFAEGGGYWPVVATTSPFEIELEDAGSVPATITFRIEGLPDGEPVLTVDHDEVVTRYIHGRDYLLHREGTFTWLVIRAIPGNVIRIVPPPVPPF
jgi:hypothetical protein